MQNLVRVAELVRQAIAADAMAGFERAGSVINPGVDDAAVPRAGAHAELGHLLEKEDVLPSRGSGTRDRATNDASTDDEDIGLVHIFAPAEREFVPPFTRESFWRSRFQ
jgi:hypothetical protein